MTTPHSTTCLLIGALIVSGASSCTRGAPPVETTVAEDAASDRSIFDLDLDLVDQDARRLKLADLGEHVTVAAMIYSSCTLVCPRITEDMKALEARLPRAADDVRFALFSIDPARDTPATLRAFADEHQLDTTRWRLMASSEDGVRNLAAVLGVRYAPEPDGEFAHSAMIFVIDRAGVVRHRQVGVGEDMTGLIDALATARQPVVGHLTPGFDE